MFFRHRLFVLNHQLLLHPLNLLRTKQAQLCMQLIGHLIAAWLRLGFSTFRLKSHIFGSIAGIHLRHGLPVGFKKPGMFAQPIQSRHFIVQLDLEQLAADVPVTAHNVR
jgi:hypothetical protein